MAESPTTAIAWRSGCSCGCPGRSRPRSRRRCPERCSAPPSAASCASHTVAARSSRSAKARVAWSRPSTGALHELGAPRRDLRRHDPRRQLRGGLPVQPRGRALPLPAARADRLPLYRDRTRARPGRLGQSRRGGRQRRRLPGGRGRVPHDLEVRHVLHPRDRRPRLAAPRPRGIRHGLRPHRPRRRHDPGARRRDRLRQGAGLRGHVQLHEVVHDHARPVRGDQQDAGRGRRRRDLRGRQRRRHGPQRGRALLPRAARRGRRADRVSRPQQPRAGGRQQPDRHGERLHADRLLGGRPRPQRRQHAHRADDPRAQEHGRPQRLRLPRGHAGVGARDRADHQAPRAGADPGRRWLRPSALGADGPLPRAGQAVRPAARSLAHRLGRRDPRRRQRGRPGDAGPEPERAPRHGLARACPQRVADDRQGARRPLHDPQQLPQRGPGVRSGAHALSQGLPADRGSRQPRPLPRRRELRHRRVPLPRRALRDLAPPVRLDRGFHQDAPGARRVPRGADPRSRLASDLRRDRRASRRLAPRPARLPARPGSAARRAPVHRAPAGSSGQRRPAGAPVRRRSAQAQPALAAGARVAGLPPRARAPVPAARSHADAAVRRQPGPGDARGSLRAGGGAHRHGASRARGPRRAPRRWRHRDRLRRLACLSP